MDQDTNMNPTTTDEVVTPVVTTEEEGVVMPEAEEVVADAVETEVSETDAE